MYRLPQEYVLVIFWDPHCGHCKKELPHIYTAYRDTLRPMGIEVYAVAKATDSTLMADWKKFIVENGLDWVNAGLTWHVYTEAKQNASKHHDRESQLRRCVGHIQHAAVLPAGRGPEDRGQATEPRPGG
jgi:hypothetical protein